MSDVITKWSPKDPSDVADYWFNWNEFLPPGENITNATVTVPDGLSKVGVEDFNGNIVRVRLAGGTAGQTYDVTCLIQTDAAETFEITKTLAVKERIK